MFSPTVSHGNHRTRDSSFSVAGNKRAEEKPVRTEDDHKGMIGNRTCKKAKERVVHAHTSGG